MKSKVGIGIIGSGFLAETRARAYEHVSGYDAELVAVAELIVDRAQSYAKRYHIPKVFADYMQLLELPEVDIVDLCVPNYLHHQMALDACRAGKHVACAKPLTGYFGDQGEDLAATPRARMLEVAVRDADAMVACAAERGTNLMYGENWVYAPAVQKARRLVEASGGAILDMRGGECHSGSHSAFSISWRYAGGGALVRLAVHAIGAALYLKRCERIARNGRPVRVASVTCETANLAPVAKLATKQGSWLADKWVDVENWATVLLGFTDGSRATLFGSDAVLGGMQSSLEIYLSNAVLQCKMTQNDELVAYAPASEVFADEYLVEKLETKAGWCRPSPDEEDTLGHYEQAQDFVAAVADGRPSLADGSLGRDVVQVVYAAYLSAEKGRRVTLPAV